MLIYKKIFYEMKDFKNERPSQIEKYNIFYFNFACKLCSLGVYAKYYERRKGIFGN